MLLVAFIMSTVMGATSAFSTSYVMFAVSRALCGMALSGLSIIGNVLGKKFLWSLKVQLVCLPRSSLVGSK